MPKRNRDDQPDDEPRKIRRLGMDRSTLAETSVAEPAEPRAHRSAPSIPLCLIEIRAGVYRSLKYYNHLVGEHISNRNELKIFREAPPYAPPHSVEQQTQKETLAALTNWEYAARSFAPELDRQKIKALICPMNEYHYVTPAFLKKSLSPDEFTQQMWQRKLPHRLAENEADQVPSTMVRDRSYEFSVCFKANVSLPAGLGSRDPFQYTDVFVKQSDGRLGNFYEHLIDRESAELDEPVLDTLGISKADYKALKLRLAFGVEAGDLSSETSEVPLEIVEPIPDPRPSEPVNRHGTRIRLDRGR